MPLPEDDPRQRCPDISRAQELLDWHPRVPLKAGLERTIAYFEGLLSTEVQTKRKWSGWREDAPLRAGSGRLLPFRHQVGEPKPCCQAQGIDGKVAEARVAPRRPQLGKLDTSGEGEKRRAIGQVARGIG